MSIPPNEQTAPNALLNKLLTAAALKAVREQVSFLKEYPGEGEFVWLYRTAYRLVRMLLTDVEVKAAVTALMGHDPNPDDFARALSAGRDLAKAKEIEQS